MVVTTNSKENKYMRVRGYPIKVDDKLVGWLEECGEMYPPIDLEPVRLETSNLRYSEVNEFGSV